MHFHRVRRGVAQGVHEIAVVEADLQLLPVAADGADVTRLAVAGAGGHIDLIRAEQAPHGAFQLLADDHADALQAFDHCLVVHLQADGVVGGDGVAIVQEFALQPAADQLGIARLEHQMALALCHGDHILGVGADLLHLVQGAARRHKLEGAAVDVLQRFAPQRQTEAVHGHHGQPLVADLEQHAGMDGARLVQGHGEAGLVDHGLQRALLQRDGVLVVHLRHFRIVVGTQADHLEVRVAAGELHVELLVRVEHHRVVGHTADHVAEQLGVQHDAAALADVGLHLGADAGLHVVARQAQAVLRLQKDTLQRGDGAFGRHRAGHSVHRLLQKRLLTGKSHHIRRSSLSETQFYSAKSNHNLIFIQ